MHPNSTLNAANDAFWGPVTATLDWCEANYQFSRYIAEPANTFSNIATVGLALFGATQSIAGRFPKSVLAGWAGLALVGIGSFVFHATLLFEAQLMDELPMIYVASYWTATSFDFTRGPSKPLKLGIFFTVLDVVFTYTYYLFRNPIYHQSVFASLMLASLFRTMYLLRSDIMKHIPEATQSSITRLFGSGALTFVFGFFIWNLDNIFCSQITRWKQAIGWPAAFFLEGHSWWHILTATGTYLMLTGCTYLTLCMKDDHSNFVVTKTFGIPCVERVNKDKGKPE